MFITLEGIEGCGKTTQLKRLAGRLERLAIPFLSTLEPGGTEVGKKVRRILLDSRNKGLIPMAELFLYAADRAQHVEEVIKPALRKGVWVLCDRFFDSTVVYQGFARGQDSRLIKFLNEKATQGLVPDLTFLLDCPVKIGLARATARENRGQDRFERENLAFHRKVREGYLNLAGKSPERFVVLDGTVEKDVLERNIFSHLKPLLPTTEGEG